ncbi:hypothetical protein CK203_055997 [Vitis vinifera]|uniref:DUF4283 domain-containing protein n=1 Tax=Vitis vinifera TaxID=29760 RepID=A0A438GS74_VITVI|nr:hypothetical protein CK203_055997 [Vitis vinifera]
MRARAMAMREITKRRSRGNGKEIVSGWSRRFLKSRWRREEVKPCFSLWKARGGFRHGLDWGWQVLGSFWRGWINALRMGKGTNGEKGVVDAEEKKYNICIPKGRGEKGGWSVMAEVIRDLIASLDRKEKKKEELIPVRMQAEMGKRWGNRDRLLVRMEVEGEEISRNLSRLGHCLVGRWNPRVAGGENLERLGWLMVSAWGLKGKLGLAWMEEGQVLLEFEFVEEARRVLTSGKRSVGGIQVGLELLESKLRVFGRRGNKRRSLAMDPLTERMENLRWARILVKTKGEVGGLSVPQQIVPEEEVRGDRGARVDPRVEEWGNARLEALSRTVDGTGRVLTVGRIQFGSTIRSSVGGAEVGPSLIGLNEDTLGLRWVGGPIPQTLSEGVTLKGVGVGGVGPEVGSKGSKGKEKVLKVEIGPRLGLAVSQRKSSGPFLTHLKDFGPSVTNSHGLTEVQLTKVHWGSQF